MEYRLLIVDDQKDLLQTLRGLFITRGYEVISVNDGTAAIDAVDKSDFDLILLDVEMPGPSGLEVLRHVKKRSPDTKVIVMTGHEEYELQAREAGCNYFLKKPFAFSNLENAITSLLGKKDYEEIKSYSLGIQMARASKGGFVADILLVEPIKELSESLRDYLTDYNRSGGHYRVYVAENGNQADILQSSLLIQIAIIGLQTNSGIERIVNELLSCPVPPVEIIYYLKPNIPLSPALLSKGRLWQGNPLNPEDLKDLASMIRNIAKTKGLIKA